MKRAASDPTAAPAGTIPGGRLRLAALLLLLPLTGCGTPEVLRTPPIPADIAPTASLPMPAIAEPTGEAPIALPEPDASGATPNGATPPAAPRSGPGERP